MGRQRYSPEFKEESSPKEDPMRKSASDNWPFYWVLRPGFGKHDTAVIASRMLPVMD